MKTLVVAAVLLAGLAAPAFAAPDLAAPHPAKSRMMHSGKMMHSMHARPAAMHPSREPSTDQLNQQQLDQHKS